MTERARPLPPSDPSARGTSVCRARAPSALLGVIALVAAAALGCVGTPIGVVPPAPPGDKPAGPAAAPPGKTEALIAEVGYHERQVYDQQKSLTLSFACVPEELWAEPENGDVRAPVALRGNAFDPQLIKAIQATFAHFDDGIRALEVLRARFSDLRRHYETARADDELLRLVIQEGLATMYQARRLLDLHRGMEVSGCSLAPLRPPLKGVADLLTQVGEVELPALLKLYDKAANPWVMTLLKIQHDVLLDHDISDVCAKVIASFKDPAPPEDTAILAWCGYAVASVDDPAFAKKYLRQAGRTVHDPESSSYALARFKELSELPAPMLRGKGLRVMR